MRRCCLALGTVLLGAALLPAADKKTPDLSRLPAAAPGKVDFDRDIRPLLARACVSCHGPEKQRSGLRLDHGPDALKGGNSGPVLRPGKAVESRLLLMVAGLDADGIVMPPEGRKPLTAKEIGLLRAWIDAGADWPEAGTTAAVARPTSDHWAFRPVRRPPLPTVKNAAGVRNAIDAFVLARLEKEGIAPSPPADPLTQLRRVHLDLTGLPPTPAELDAFLADPSPEAYEKAVDRLLASPHYGERWARHWLDLARYADSDGYEKDSARPFAYRFRDWVIDALNRDLPFDQFTLQQLAGDLLPDAGIDEKLATGFHRNTLTNREGGVDQEQFRVEAVVDRVNTTAKVWLGLTLNCAQCHDHKYDPFTQRDYYAFFAFFNSDREADIPAPTPGDDAAFRKAQAAFDADHAKLQEAVSAYRKDELPARQQAWETALKPAQRKKLPEPVQQALAVAPEKRTAAQAKTVADHFAKADKQLTALTKAVTDHAKKKPKPALAQTLTLGPTRPTHVMIRGDFLRPGVAVQPAVPALFAPTPDGSKGTRLDLARWIVRPDNPLTARVLVNWVWHYYFGRGLVATLEDFGTRGEKPSHPELLDRLASEFVRQKWSLKQLHRLIVTSATYRQSSATRPDLEARDPLNVLLARQSRLRLDAEAVRDVALAASGLLSPKVGGPSVRPPQPPGISELTYAGSARWVESKGDDRYRRGLYTWFQRTSPYPMLMTFDAPDSNVSCVRRERSNTPLQALTLLNDAVFVECAQALARRVLTEKPDVPDAERLTHAFRLCTARTPTADEMAVLGNLLAGLRSSAQTDPAGAAKLVGSQGPRDVPPAEAAAWVALARTLLNLDEFVTRE